MMPKGKVASYGQIVLYADSPRAARQVGWILAELSLSEELPRWSVVDKKGKIIIKNNAIHPLEQMALLGSERVIVDNNYCVDTDKYRYNNKSKN